jgi:hypothetical protein
MWLIETRVSTLIYGDAVSQSQKAFFEKVHYNSKKSCFLCTLSTVFLKILRAVSRETLICSFLDVVMRQNGFFFRNLHEKLGKKMLWKNIFFGQMGV